MPIAGYRWMMTAAGAPLERQEACFDPAADELVVAVAGCGVCHTDLGYYYDGVRTNAPLPLALGHEISGRVVAAGAGAEQWVGAAVLVPAVIPCGQCDVCHRGHSTICRHQKMPGNDIQGGFASHIVIPQTGLCPVDPARLDPAGLALSDISVVADAVTTPYQAVFQAGVAPEDLAVVIGVGGVGGYCAQMAKAFGAAVVALDVDPSRLAALDAQGVLAASFDVREVSGRDLKNAIGEVARAQNRRPTEWKIFECSGSAAGQQTAYGLLVHGATLAVVGFTMDKVEVRLSNLMAFHARALGNWGCDTALYPAALDMVLDGKVLLKPFIETHPMDDINRIFAAAHDHTLDRRAILVPGPAH